MQKRWAKLVIISLIKFNIVFCYFIIFKSSELTVVVWVKVSDVNNKTIITWTYKATFRRPKFVVKVQTISYQWNNKVWISFLPHRIRGLDGNRNHRGQSFPLTSTAKKPLNTSQLSAAARWQHWHRHDTSVDYESVEFGLFYRMKSQMWWQGTTITSSVSNLNLRHFAQTTTPDLSNTNTHHVCYRRVNVSQRTLRSHRQLSLKYKSLLEQLGLRLDLYSSLNMPPQGHTASTRGQHTGPAVEHGVWRFDCFLNKTSVGIFFLWI